MIIQRFVLPLALAVCVFITAGCASILGKSDYPVVINSTPSGASIIIADQAGKQVFAGTTPTTATLKSGRGYFKGNDYTIKFMADGYSSVDVPIKRGTSAWYILGNIVVGGLIGWLIVDPITGAMYTLPDEVSATMTPDAAADADTPSLKMMTLADVPADMRNRLLRLN